MPSTNATYVSAYTGDDSIPVFLSFAIEEYGRRKGIGASAASELMARAGVLSHLAENYDVMHTQGVDWLVGEIDSMVGHNNSAV